MKDFFEKPIWFRPTSDVGFHKLFCTEGNDELVLQLLNAVIDDKTIVSFKRLDSYHQINEDTHSVFDLYCTCNDDSHIMVECQNGGNRRKFMNRALAYSAMAILDQAEKGWQYQFDKVYFVGLMNYNFWKKRAQAVTKIALYTEDDHILANDNYLQIFVELPKLAANTDVEDFGKLFLRAMRDIGNSNERPEEYGDKRLDTLYDLSKYNHLTDEEQNNYDRSMTTVEDLMDYAKVLGEEEREEGKAEGKAEVAKKLLDLGVDISIIVKSTGLTEAEIKAL